MNKKLAGIFAMCALLLTGCQGAKESSKEITPPDTGSVQRAVAHHKFNNRLR
mgnify:CR=1 FL=1